MHKLRQYSFKVEDWEINAVVAGSGPPILFLHGIGLSGQWWQSSLDALSRDFTVCTIDLPGSGRSSPLTSPPHAGLYKALVARAIETFTIEPTTIIGHSLGGYVALQAAMQDTPGIRGLFLVAPAGFGPMQNRYLRLLVAPGVGDLLARTGKIGLSTLLRSLVYDRRTVSKDVLQWIDLSAKKREQFLYQLRLGFDMFGNTKDAFAIKPFA